LRGHLDSRHRRVFRNVANLVDLDAGFAGERGFQLFCEGGRLGITAGERTHKSRELRLRERGRKMDARNAGGNQ
jgi:hypothetical protein